MISAQSPKNTSRASSVSAPAAGAGRQPRAWSQWTPGSSSVVSSTAMITGRTTIIIRAAPSATSTTPPTTTISRSVMAEATASPRGTASSPLSSAGTGRSARPLDERVYTGAVAMMAKG